MSICAVVRHYSCADPVRGCIGRINTCPKLRAYTHLDHVYVFLILKRCVQLDDVFVLQFDVYPNLSLYLIPAGPRYCRRYTPLLRHRNTPSATQRTPS